MHFKQKCIVYELDSLISAHYANVFHIHSIELKNIDHCLLLLLDWLPGDQLGRGPQVSRQLHEPLHLDVTFSLA